MRGVAIAGALSVLALSPPPALASAPPSQPPATATPTPAVPIEFTPALVELTGLTPLDATTGDTVTFEGTITNRSDESLGLLNAYLRLSRIPMRDRADLALLADPSFRPGARQAAFVLAADVLDPGDRTSFQLDVPAADLALGQPGVYAVGIEVLATRADDSRGVVGRVMTALPWVPAVDAIKPIGVALAWPVTAPVDLAVDGTYLTDELVSAMDSGGRLAAVLETTAESRVTWLVDPAVVEAAIDLADGYHVRANPNDPASARPGTGAGVAADWLEQVRGLASAGRVTLTPYAGVDIVALERTGLSADVMTSLDAAAAAAQALGLGRADGPTDLIRPPGGVLDESTAERLVAAGVTTLLLDSSGVATSGSAPTAARLTVGDSTITAVLADAALQDLFAADPALDEIAGPGSELLARQLLLAHTALVAIGAPSDTGFVGQTVLVVSGDESSNLSPASVLDALDQDVPWMQPATLDAVRASPMVDGELNYPDEAAAAELPPAYVAAVTALQQKVALRAALGPETVSVVDQGASEPSWIDPVTADRLRLLSAGWRREPGRASQVLAEADRAIDAELGQVRLLGGGSVTLSSQTGRFPLTVVNDLTVPVTVQLTLVSKTPARLRVPTITGIEVAPGARTTVDVSAEANANGQYIVEAQLATSNGMRFGPASTLTIRATDYDTVAWIIMGAAGGLLVIGSFRRIKRRIRAARTAPTPTPAPTVQR